ncbi:MAG: two-component regulator propeller domain-containing protein, partial [Planctomycetota bacterium]
DRHPEAVPLPPELRGRIRALVCIRHQGRLWCATRGLGILRRREEPAFRGTSIPDAREVVSLAVAPDGSVWCGTENGLAHVRGRIVERVTHIDGEPLGLVTACAVDRSGRLWVGSGSAWTGVYRRDPEGWKRFGREQGFVDAFVHRISTDSTGRLWFSTLNTADQPQEEGQGAWFFAGGVFQRSPANPDLPSGRVYDVIVRDPAGVLWFATLRGLAAYRRGVVTEYGTEQGLLGEKIWCLHAAREGGVWIGYQHGEHGVSLLRGERVRHFNVEDGLCDGDVWSIAEGEPGVFWFATGNGLGRYDGLRWSSFRAHEGIGAHHVWPLLPAGDGRLWMGTVDRTVGGRLVELVIRDRERPQTRLDPPGRPPESGRPFTLSWRGTDAWFDTPSADLWYRTKVDGGAWSAASPRRRLSLRLDAGRHRVSVQAIDRFGNAETPPAVIDVPVERAAAAPGAILVAVGAGLGLLAALLLLRRRAAPGVRRPDAA